MRIIKMTSLSVILGILFLWGYSSLSYAEEPALQEIEAVSTAVSDHKSSPGLPQFDTTWFPSQIFWLLVCFGFLYIFFAKKTLPTLSSIIDRRCQKIESDMEITESLTTESEGIYNEYQKALKEAHANARSIITDMESSLKRQANENHKIFRETAKDTISKAEDRITLAKEDCMMEVHTISSEIAAETVKKILNREIDAKNLKSIMNSFIKDDSESLKDKKKKAA